MQAQKLLFLLLVFFMFTQLGYSQQKESLYGNNPAAGKYYDVRGIKFYTEVYGTGKPLLLIHGNGSSIHAFENTIPYFSKKYKVIAVDSRAHGKSRDDRDSLSFEMMADDFAGLLDAMHIDSAYVIGWSDGGINAIELTMRHPQKVIKFAATGANLWPDSTGLIPSYWKQEQTDYNAKKNNVRKTAKEKNDWKVFMLDWLQPNIKLTELKAIKCPALIIGGDHDLIPTQHTVLISQNIPKAYLWIVPNSGHGTLIEHRDEFNKKVDEFFEQPYNNR
ncbi:alpha/beta fold hydrolase [Mucilaginibacter sp. SP1R1]|uniref:alpha/beta fold hydrolase n=1 Tax=Mucilaginibacter sp. SP1R1 TaxID=2723091 RepID=UPI0017F21669|nr:alpha/beta hydrolase [Mucilaginibacter sp. SP1R1]MBB6149634.1 pimeloyl-ACP methyl ester carboxylesterase [Mucilaginibacter sp. SP1R1]